VLVVSSFPKVRRSKNLVAGLILGVATVAGFLAPFVFLVLGRYADALIAVPTPFIALIFAPLAYILLWDGLFQSQSPYAKAMGTFISRALRNPISLRR
jgi:predicted tellurium resistance membrane protein TerC